MTIYIDGDYKCYLAEAPDRRAIETDMFNGKCKTYIEGHRFVPFGETWVRSDGEEFSGLMIAPWRDYSILDEAQAAYDEAMALSQETISDMQTALNTLGVN